MSDPLRESLQSIVDDVYDHTVETIAKDRHLPDYTVKTLLDQGLFSAADAKDAGLIDDVCYTDEFENSLRGRLEVGKVDVDSAYKKKQVDTDFSGLGGFVKLMEALSGGKKSETQPAATSRRSPSSTPWGRSPRARAAPAFSAKARWVQRRWSRPSRRRSTIPRSWPWSSASIAPVVRPLPATLSGTKPSAARSRWWRAWAMWPAAAATISPWVRRRSSPSPATLTGSIGVVGGKLVTAGLYEKLGLNTEVISRGKNSGILTSTNPFTPDERKIWMRMMEQTYHEFVSKAAQGRKMDYNRLEALAQGRVYTGRQAKKLGLVDEIGTLADAVTAAKKLAGLKPDADVDLMVLPQPRSLFEQLFGGEGPELDEFTASLPSFLKHLRSAAAWKQLLGSRVMLWMPYHVELK